MVKVMLSPARRAKKTEAAIDAAIDSDGGNLFRKLLLKHLPAIADAYREGSVDVDYVEDEKLGLFVPVRMRETYQRPSSPKSDRLDVLSEYSNFRRFDVSVTEQIALP